MSKYKKPKIGFNDFTEGKTDKSNPIDEVLNEAKENPAPKPQPKVETKKPVITEEKKTSDGMSSYVKATQVDDTSAKGSFDSKTVEGYVPPILEEKKPEVNPKAMTAYQKAVRAKSKNDKRKLQEAADLLGGEIEKPVTQADLKQIKVSLASLGGGGLGEQDVIELVKKYGADSLTDILTPDQINQIIGAFERPVNTDSLPEGNINLYYTDARVDSNFALKTTDDLTEGSTNLYFTEDRARQSIQSIDSAIVYDPNTGNIELNTNAFDTYNTADHDSDTLAQVDSAYVIARIDDVYVNKSGDSMTGQLEWDTQKWNWPNNTVIRIGPSASSYWIVNTSGSVSQQGDLKFRNNAGNSIDQDRGKPLAIKIDGVEKFVFDSGQTRAYTHLIVDDPSVSATDYNFQVRTQGASKFGVLGNGSVLLGNSSSDPFMGSQPHHAVSVALLDSAVALLDSTIDGLTKYDLSDFDSHFALKTTDSLSEGVLNLYYTDSRSRAAIQSVDSSLIYDEATGNLSLAIDPNEFYTTEDFDSDFLTKTTDSLAEGSDNLYYTDERVESLVDSAYVNARAYTPENTDSLPEGVANLYYTSARFDSDASGINIKLDSLEDRLDSDDIEIQTLKNKVHQLDLSSSIQIQYNKILSYDSATDSVPVGFYGLHFDGTGTEYNNIDKLFIHHTDRNGVHVPFGIIDSGDTIIIGDSDGGLGRYQVDKFEDRGNHHEFDVSVQAGQGAPADLAAMKIYPEQNLNALASMDYVDAQDKTLQDQINQLDSAVDSEHAWNVSEHAALDSDLSAQIDSEHAWNVEEHRLLDSEFSEKMDSEHAWNVSEHSSLANTLDSDLSAKIDSDHNWAADKFNSLDSGYVNVTGDTMTGSLYIDSASLEVRGGGNVKVFGGNIEASQGHIQTNELKSAGNSNIVVKRNNERRMLWGTNNIIADKKIRYNSGYSRDSYSSDLANEDSYTLMPKWYIDSSIESLSSQVDSELNGKVNKSGDTMTGDLTISDPYRLNTNQIWSIGNNDINIKRNNVTKVQITETRFKIRTMARYNTDYAIDSDLVLPHKKYVDDAIDSAVANASFEFDSSQFVDVTGDTMTGELFMDSAPIVLKNDVGTAKVFKTQQGASAETLSINATGAMNWSNNGVATLNKSGGDMTFSIDDIAYMQIDQSGTEVDFFKGIKLNDPERSIDVNGGESGKLKHSGSSRLLWDDQKVEVQVPLHLSDEPTEDNHAATKKYVDDNAGGGSSPTNVIVTDASTEVTTDFKILGASKTFIQNSANQLGLYNLKEPTSSHHAATKNYVDTNFADRSNDQSIGGKKTFTSYIYLSNSSNNASGVLRRDTIEALISAAGGGDYKITKSGSNYYIEPS